MVVHLQLPTQSRKSDLLIRVFKCFLVSKLLKD